MTIENQQRHVNNTSERINRRQNVYDIWECKANKQMA